MLITVPLDLFRSDRVGDFSIPNTEHLFENGKIPWITYEMIKFAFDGAEKDKKYWKRK